jgi:hypothetical protein
LKWKGENVLVSLNLLYSNIYANKRTAGNHDLMLVNPARGADDVIITGEFLVVRVWLNVWGSVDKYTFVFWCIVTVDVQ